MLVMIDMGTSSHFATHIPFRHFAIHHFAIQPVRLKGRTTT